MSNVKEFLEKSGADKTAEDTFERRYQFFISHTVTSLEELTRLPSSERIFSLRMVGVILMGVSLLLRAVRGGDYLTPIEFIVVFGVATLLLILGSYFQVKDQQEKSRLLQKTGEVFMSRFQARSGLMNPDKKQDDAAAGGVSKNQS
jgi:hypothetical protein